MKVKITVAYNGSAHTHEELTRVGWLDLTTDQIKGEDGRVYGYRAAAGLWFDQDGHVLTELAFLSD